MMTKMLIPQKHPSWIWRAKCLACFLILSGAAAAQTPSARIRVHPQVATVGDPIQIDLEFSLPRESRLIPPQLQDSIGEFAILEGPAILPGQPGADSASAAPSADLQQHQVRIVAAVFKTGEFEFPSLSFKTELKEGKQETIATPAVKIRIESVLAGTDEAIKDLKKQAEIEEPFPWLTYLAIAGAALLLALGIWLWRRRRHPTAVPQPRTPDTDPLALAEAEMKELLAQGLLQKGMVKQFYVRISEIIKRALESSYGIQTVERTTEEIMESLSSSEDIGSTEAAWKRPIERFLLACDVVKFARYTPDGPESDMAVKDALQILQNCRGRRMYAHAQGTPATGGHNVPL